MSHQAIKWAYDQANVRSSAKFILVVMADYTNEQALFYGSYARLAAATNLNRKTVIDALKYLEQRGYITDTLQRTGRTSSIKVYQLEMNRDDLKGSGTPEAEPKTPAEAVPEEGPDTAKTSSPENGTTEKMKQSQFRTEAVPISDGSSPNFGTQSKTKQQQNNKEDRHARDTHEHNSPQPPTDPPHEPDDEMSCQVGDVTLILQAAGLPFSALSRHDHIECMRDIAQTGVTQGELRQAIEKARAAKGSQPFGVFYIRPIVSEIVARRNGYAKTGGPGDHRSGGDALSTWLAEDGETPTAQG